MSLSPNSSLVRHTIDLNYSNKKRSESLKWIFINSALLIIFSFDLWNKCPGYTSVFHYCEGAGAAAALASAACHVLRLLPRRRRVITYLSPRQQRLLGLADGDLDSTFQVSTPSPPSPVSCESDTEEQSPASLSPVRAWRVGGGSPRAPATPPSPPDRAPRDEFIADHEALQRYLSAQEAAESVPENELTQYSGAGGPRVHQLAAPAAAPPPAPGAPAVWRRLHVDPTHLVQFELNLRRWIHETILVRLVRELDECPEAVEGSSGSARARALVPFVRPFPDRRQVARRVRELARGGCMAAYRWQATECGDDGPSDAELVLHLFCAYMDGVTAGAFSAAHVYPAGGSPALQLASRRPPHCVVWVGSRAAEVSRGRHNLLHSLLLFLAAAAAETPPALARHALGPHGLNMLWILGR